MPDRPQPVRIAVPWWALVAAGTPLLIMIILLGFQLAAIEDQRSTVDRQLANAVRQTKTALPLIKDARPLVADLNEHQPALRRFGRDAAALVRETTPLVQELDRARLPEQVQTAGALSRTLVRADVGGTTRAVRRLTDTFARQRRLERLLVRANTVLGQARALDTVPKATRAAELVPVQTRILRDSRRIQAQTLEMQRQALAAIRETQTIVRDVERHAESLDTKTGGTAPGGGGLPTGLGG